MFLFLKSISDNEPHLYDYLTLSPPHIHLSPPPHSIQENWHDQWPGQVSRPTQHMVNG